MLTNYKVADFNNLPSIGILCRGASLSYLTIIKDRFQYCFIVGQFDNAMCKIGKYLNGKYIVQIINKCAIKPDKNIFSRYGIVDIQCNFGSYFGEKLSREKINLYNKIKKVNPNINIHLVTPTMIKHRSSSIKSWPTCGIFAVDLASFCCPKNMYILGLDFYYSDYFCKEKIKASAKSNRKRSGEMISAFMKIVDKNNKIMFYLYTRCKKIKTNKNLVVQHV